MSMYFLCSSAVVDNNMKIERSAPFQSGFSNSDDFYYVVRVNDVSEIANPKLEKSPDYWYHPCEDDPNVKLDRLRKVDLHRIGIIQASQIIGGFKTYREIAKVIAKFAIKHSTNPIGFVNGIKFKKGVV